MITYGKKKFYIIGSNPRDFFDLTLESFKIISDTDIIIFSHTYHKNFREIFIKNKKNFFYVEYLSQNLENLLNKIWILFNDFNTISYLIPDDPLLNSNKEIDIFFKEKKIKVERILGIIDVVNTLNKKKHFLTNRKTNSSFSFFTPSSKDKLKKFLNKGKFEKLILKVLNKSILIEIEKYIHCKKSKKFKYTIFSDGKNLKFFRQIKLEKKLLSTYIIIEDAKI